jgi:hypothetical protein
MHTSEKCRRGKQHISHRESERKREREREREERGRERRLRIKYNETRFVLFCVNTEAIAGEDEKEDKRQHKYDASLK